MSDTPTLRDSFAAIERHLDDRLDFVRKQADDAKEDLEAVRQVRISIQRKAEELERVYNTVSQNVGKIANEYERLAALKERAENAMALKPPGSPQAPKRAIRAIRAVPRLRQELASASVEIAGCEAICGVYFLLHDTEVVYVGQSIGILSRVATHSEEGLKTFNRWCYLKVKRDQLDELESFYITLLRPKYNIRGKPVLVTDFVAEVLAA